MSYAGSINNSTEIKRENFITSCFKENVESWLKRVLQMDPANRTFTKDLSAFDYLRFILDKKIIQVSITLFIICYYINLNNHHFIWFENITIYYSLSKYWDFSCSNLILNLLTLA